MENIVKVESPKENKIVYLEYLRVFASFAVIMIHLSAQNWYSTNVNTREWMIFNAYDSIVSFAAPVFVMISGAVFLEKEKTIQTLFKKYILRIAVAFAFWSIIYAGFMGGGKRELFINIFKGHYHMWFLPMIIGIYLLVPVLHKIAEDEKMLKYFLFLSFLFAFLLPQLIQMTTDFGNGIFLDFMNIVNYNLNFMSVKMVLGYTGYFLTGYYLNKYVLSRPIRIIIYCLGLIGAFTTIILDSFLAIKTQGPVGTYCGNHSVNILFECLAVFVWFKYHITGKSVLRKPILKISKFCFGAYLLHPLLIEQLNIHFGINTFSLPAIISVPILTLGIFLMSFLISGILNAIPVIKKYIV